MVLNEGPLRLDALIPHGTGRAQTTASSRGRDMGSTPAGPPNNGLPMEREESTHAGELEVVSNKGPTDTKQP